MTLNDTPSGEEEAGFGPEEASLLKALFQQNRARERLEAGNYQSADQRTVDVLLVALPELLQAAGDALEHRLTVHQRAEELHTIDEGPDDVIRRHPELTTIPVDAFRAKGNTLGVRPPQGPR